MSPRFELIPALDLLGGRYVRLAPEGHFDAAPLLEHDPAALARRYLAHPVRRLHVVDLDGARSGQPENAEALAEILKAAGRVPVQVGGGLRSLAHVEQRLALGVERVILGTAALRDPGFVREAARLHPGRVAVGLDAKQGRVAVEGWLQASELTALELARRFEDAGVAALVYTDIARDGTLSGPDLELTAALAEAVSIPVIASGGVGGEADVRAVARLAPRGVAGVIVGRALASGALDLARALEIAACS